MPQLPIQWSPDPANASVIQPHVQPHVQPCPGAKTAFVFSCPGQQEEQLGYPCAGATGRNLNAALLELHALLPAVFPSSQRGDYVITNAWSHVEYPAKTGRSEATREEVLSSTNLDRLAHELAGVETILICGQKAKHGVLALQAQNRLMRLAPPMLSMPGAPVEPLTHGAPQPQSARIAIVMHLSPLAVNSHKAWRGLTTPQRLAAWAQGVVEQLLDNPAPSKFF